MEFPQDDLKWFGEGFEGFPKKLPDDVVEYVIFVVDTRLSDIQTRERLQAFQRALNTLEKKFLKEYIWQRDAINLELVREGKQWLLRGRMNYGDSVADEWLVVYFLRELSQEFKDAWIRVYDSDGEFLLIEAASALPKWLNPEVSENRVWINNHRLLIIPLGKEELPNPLTQEQALEIIRVTPARPQQYIKVEKEAFHRLHAYPAAISENQHHATLPLPRKVVHILHLNPSYIASVVEAFYLRDPISVRLLQPDKSQAPLIFPPEDFVEVSVRFTKVLYAQLLGQYWSPPPPWDSALENLIKSGNATEKSEIGIKLASGMQMLVAHSIFIDKKAAREIKLLLEDLETEDDSLPTDAEIAGWPKREDDEGWLNIDFSEFERELEGKGSSKMEGFGDKNAQENLKKMVERFNSFLADNEAGIEGADGQPDPMDEDNDSDVSKRGWDDPDDSESGGSETVRDSSKFNDKRKTRATDVVDAIHSDNKSDNSEADAEYAEYEQAFEKFMTLSAAEKAILTDEARALALAQDAEKLEDEEIQKLTQMMEAELFSHGALDINPKLRSGPGTGLLKDHSSKPSGKGKSNGKAKLEEVMEEVSDDEDDDEDDDLLDEDYNLADNMLKAFKGQAGMAGPAGNMMKLMGVQFPRDADDEINGGSSKTKSQTPQ